MEIAVGTKPKRTIHLEIKRGESVLDVDLLTEAKTRYEMGYAGFSGKIQVQANMVTANSPAEKAGLKPRDVIVAIDGKEIHFNEFTDILEKSPEKELDFLIERDEELLHLKITPKREGKVGKIGLYHSERSRFQKYGFSCPDRLDRFYQSAVGDHQPFSYSSPGWRTDPGAGIGGDFPKRFQCEGQTGHHADRICDVHCPYCVYNPQ